MKNTFFCMCATLLLITELAYSDELPKTVKTEPSGYPPKLNTAETKSNSVINFKIDDADRTEPANLATSSGFDGIDKSQKTQNKVIDSSEKYDIPPKLIATVPTIYPIEARRYGLQGEVLLACILDAGGKLISVNLIKGSGYAALDEAAAETVKSYKFSSAVLNGKNVAAEKQLKITFTLSPSEEDVTQGEMAKEFNFCGERINDATLRTNISQLLIYAHFPERTAQALTAAEAGLDKKIFPYLSVRAGEQLSPKQRKLLDVRNNLIERLRSDFAWSNIEPIFIKSYCDTFTDEEIEKMFTFYKSQIGQEILRKESYLNAKADTRLRAIWLALGKTMYDNMLAAGVDLNKEALQD